MKQVVLLGVYALAVLLKLGCAAPQHEVSTPSIEDAKKAVMQLKPHLAKEIFERVFNDTTAGLKDRAEAGRKLGRMTWHVYGQLGEARQVLERAISFEAKTFQSFVVLSGIELEAGNYGRSRAAAKLARVAARSRYEVHDSYVAFARATLDEMSRAVLDRSTGHGAESVAINRDLLSESFAMIDTVVKEEPGQIVLSEVFLGLSLLLRNGPKAYEAWCHYYRISEDSPAAGVLEKPGRTLKRILPSWTAQELPLAERQQLLIALAESRFFGYAVLLANLLLDDTSKRLREINDVIAYQAYVQQIKGASVSFYKLRAVGRGSKGDFKARLAKEAKVLWRKLHWEQNSPTFSMNRFHQEIQKRFGTDVRLTDLGLSMGHRVIDEQREVEQYGKRAKLRYISLDFMVSNNYTSWLWDGRAQTGGWAANSVITQVRRAYADGGLLTWRFISDSLKIKEAQLEIKRLRAPDDLKAQANPSAYLPGLSLRIKRKVSHRLLNDLRANGLTGTKLRAAFISEADRRKVEASIFAHEGRHALDRQDLLHWQRTGAQKEFNAKLSEVAFASDPFLAIIGGILLSNIGDETSHGRANERIMQGLVNWMSEHRAEIDGLNPKRPLLPQLDRLTDEQLKRAVRKMDSMAN